MMNIFRFTEKWIVLLYVLYVFSCTEFYQGFVGEKEVTCRLIRIEVLLNEFKGSNWKQKIDTCDDAIKERFMEK